MQKSDAESCHALWLRPSPTAAQDLTTQRVQLDAVGCGKVYCEKNTGTHVDRPQLRKLLAALQPGDVVLTTAVDRISRDTTDLMVIARQMKAAGAGLRSLAEPFLDTTSDFSEVVLAIHGVAAKLERRRVKERTELGRAMAKAQGVKFGRKPKLTPHQRREAERVNDFAPLVVMNLVSKSTVVAARFCRSPAG